MAEGSAMNVFVAGGTGAIGRVLVPMLVAEGHRVVAMTRSADRARQLEAMGAEAVVGDVFDRPRLVGLVARARPQIVIHQLTAYEMATLLRDGRYQDFCDRYVDESLTKQLSPADLEKFHAQVIASAGKAVSFKAQQWYFRAVQKPTESYVVS
jgi:NAD(P)-dependent dehydrogenase (short-subunit alcohol dehydrogenase family)